MPKKKKAPAIDSCTGLPFTASSTRQCDVCNKSVNLGLAGEANWTSHLASTAHKDNQKKKSKGSGVAGRLTNFFSKAKNNIVGDSQAVSQPVSSATRNLPSSSSTALALTRTSSPPVPLSPPLAFPEFDAPPPLPITPSSSPLFTRLRSCIQSLPPTVPEATTQDVISTFTSHPESMLTEDAEPWEVFDQALNVLVGYNQTSEEVSSVIRRGALGMDGLATFIERCVRPDWGITEGLVLGKVERLIDAMRTLGATDEAPLSVPPMVPPETLKGKEKQPSAVPVVESREGMDENAHEGDDDIQEISGEGFVVSSKNTARNENKISLSSQPKRLQVVKHAPAPLLPCPGYQLPVPEGEHALALYPTLIDAGARALWTVHTDLDRAVFLKAADCLKTAYISRKGTNSEAITMPCVSCRQLEHNNTVAGIRQRAFNGAHPNTGWKFLSATHMVSLLNQKNQQLNDLRLNALNMMRTIGVRNRHLQEWKRLPMAVSQGDIPRLQSLIATHHRSGRGIFSLLEKIDNAAKRKYSPKRYDNADFQRAYLFYRLGGRSVANLAHKTLGTPSIDQTKRKIKTVKLQSSPAFPTASEVKANIRTCFPEAVSTFSAVPPAPIRGMSIQVDELKVSERFRYNPVDNTIIGVCREHGGRCNLKFNGMSEADALLECIKKNEVHFATEASFIGIGIFSKESSSYLPRPIVISGSCKRETVSDHERLLRLCRDSAKDVLDARRYRLYCISTDGDARRRQALVPLTMGKILPKTSPIYPLLGHLPLFNLRCGDDDLTCDFDTKHNLKRLRNTAVRAKGFSINGVQISRATLRHHLLEGGMSKSTADSVLAPNDKQDVVLMIKLLHAISNLPPPDEKDGPTAQSTRRTLRLLGRLYHYLLSAYMDVSLSLYQQLVYLSAAAHLLLAIYHEDRGKFIPVQTYHDIMSQIKNVYFCVAKTQVDDPEAEFFIILIGTDGLEHIFGKIRTMIGNDTNCDVEQLYDRADAARQCQQILESNPTWGGITRRLQTKPLSVSTDEIDSSLDHVSPCMWKGNVHVSGVDLGQCWEAGLKLAEEDLAEAKFPSPLDRMTKTRGFDILCPFGDSKVVLVEATLETGERDETLEEIETVADELPTAASSEQTNIPPPSITPSLEDIAASEEQEDADSSSPWVHINTTRNGSGPGRRVHKASVLRLYSSPFANADSKDRLKRVRGYSQYTETSTRPLLDALLDCDTATAPSLNEDPALISILDPALTLIRADERIFLAVFQVTGIHYSGSDVQELAVSTLHEPNIRINGQIMTLALIQGPYDDTLGEWEWIGKFEPKGTFYDLEGNAVELIDPPLAPATQGKDVGADTYVFKTTDLQGIASLIYERVLNHEIRLPNIALSTTFPYRSEIGEACFVCESNSNGTTVEDTRTCPYCQHIRVSDLSGPNLLKHMAVHIRNDPRVKYSDSPCGFCLSTGSTCEIRLNHGTGSKGVASIDMVHSRCPNLRSIRISNAATFSNGQPCTNHPLKCPICAAVVWKYNLERHIKDKHPTATVEKYRALFEVTKDEEQALLSLYTKKTRVAKKATHASILKVSDAHSSRNALLTQQSNAEPEPEAGELDPEHVDVETTDPSPAVAVNAPNNACPTEAEARDNTTEAQGDSMESSNDTTEACDDISGPIASSLGEAEDIDDIYMPFSDEQVRAPPELPPSTPANLASLDGEEDAGRGKRTKRKRIFGDALDDDNGAIICHVCGLEVRADETVSCSMPGCGLTYHFSCKKLDAIPVGTWFCDNDCKYNAGAPIRQTKRRR